MTSVALTFLAPGRLWLLLGVAGLVVAYAVLQQRRRHYAVRFTNLELLAAVAPRRPGWRRHVAAGTLLAALAVLTVGYARPTRAERVPREEATVVLAIDTSVSMAATDVVPSRLAAAQRAATDFVGHLPARFQLGLITFDGVAQVVVPPTVDRQAVSSAIDRIELGPRTAAGEAVFAALEVVAEASAAGAREGKDIPARIVLMSDGATNTGRPVVDAAAAAKAAKVPISTIAYGTDAGTVTILGRIISVPVDRDALQQLADMTDGKAFTAASGEELAAVYRDIGTSIGYTTERREATALFAGLALVLAFAGVAAGLVWGGRVL